MLTRLHAPSSERAVHLELEAKQKLGAKAFVASLSNTIKGLPIISLREVMRCSLPENARRGLSRHPRRWSISKPQARFSEAHSIEGLRFAVLRKCREILSLEATFHPSFAERREITRREISSRLVLASILSFGRMQCEN